VAASARCFAYSYTAFLLRATTPCCRRYDARYAMKQRYADIEYRAAAMLMMSPYMR